MIACKTITVATCQPHHLTCKEEELLQIYLDDAERVRLARYRDSNAKQQYLVAHVLLRSTLSSQYPTPLSEWRYCPNDHGRPMISRPSIASGISFSLSHTRSLVACSVSKSFHVGIDVENIREDFDIAELMPYVLSQREQSRWARSTPEEQKDGFFRLWTLKEALLKGTGHGLRINPVKVGFDLRAGSPPKLTSLPTELGKQSDWSFRVLRISDDHACALAVHTNSETSFRVNMIDVSIKQLIDSATKTEREYSHSRCYFVEACGETE